MFRSLDLYVQSYSISGSFSRKQRWTLIQRNFQTSSALPRDPDTASTDGTPICPQKVRRKRGAPSSEDLVVVKRLSARRARTASVQGLGESLRLLSQRKRQNPSGDGTAGIWAKAGVSLEKSPPAEVCGSCRNSQGPSRDRRRREGKARRWLFPDPPEVMSNSKGERLSLDGTTAIVSR